jgi:MFS transporter, APGE family, 1-arseno-3-phosphoglycerate exporter
VNLGRRRHRRASRSCSQSHAGVNLLAAARIFLFGARDVWFVVGLLVFLYVNGWSFIEVGGCLAAWTIAYGAVQAAAPRLVARSVDGLNSDVPGARRWSLPLVAIPMGLALALQFADMPRADLVVATGLALFGLAFAVNSSLHSYLILAYAGSEKAAEDVGFYYAANASGRLMGTFLSGLLYHVGGMRGCLVGSAAMLALCWLITLLRRGPSKSTIGARPPLGLRN